MSLIKIAPYIIDSTLDFTFNNVTATGNLVSLNANLGNLATANYFSGNGSSLSGIVASNIVGQVANALVAGTVYTNAQPNITSVGTLTSLAVTGNVTAGNLTTSGSSGNISGANNITANYFIGNGASLSAIAGGNVTGQVGYAAVANSVAVANVSGIGNIATINKDGNASNILYGNGVFSSAPVTYANSNVATFLASFGSNTITTTGNVTVGNIIATNIGNLAALNKDGNSSNVLYGNGVFAAAPVGGGGSSSGTGTAVNVDTFTGDGTTTSFTLSATPESVNNVIINYNGAFVSRNSYSVSGTTLTFGSAPANGSKIEVSSLAGLGTGTATFNTRTYTGDGTTSNFTVTNNVTVSTVLVTLDGVLQTPTTDYTISGTTLSFTSAPYNGAAIQIRELGVAIATANLPLGLQGLTNTSVKSTAMLMSIIFGG